MSTVLSGAAPVPAPATARFETILDDLDLYRRWHRAFRGGTPLEVAMEHYLREGSAGLQAYARTYSVDARRMADAVRSRPGFYAQLADARRVVEQALPDVHAATERLADLAAPLPATPAFYFVGAFGPGATPREVFEGGTERLAVLIPVELTAIDDETDMSEFPDGAQGRGGPQTLASLVAHELGHVAQISRQGLDEYRHIYRDSEAGTHLAFAVREGTADLLSFLASGQLRQRHLYVMQNERRLWHQFAPFLESAANEPTGWFSHKDGQGTDRPLALGYGIGWAACRFYLEGSPDRRQALEQLLSASRAADFARIIDPYAQWIGGSHPRSPPMS